VTCSADIPVAADVARILSRHGKWDCCGQECPGPVARFHVLSWGMNPTGFFSLFAVIDSPPERQQKSDHVYRTAGFFLSV